MKWLYSIYSFELILRRSKGDCGVSMLSQYLGKMILTHGRTRAPGSPVLQAGARLDPEPGTANTLPLIEQIRKAGATSLQAISDALNARGVRTARGGRWAPMTVKRILDRAMV